MLILNLRIFGISSEHVQDPSPSLATYMWLNSLCGEGSGASSSNSLVKRSYLSFWQKWVNLTNIPSSTTIPMLIIMLFLLLLASPWPCQTPFGRAYPRSRLSCRCCQTAQKMRSQAVTWRPDTCMKINVYFSATVNLSHFSFFIQLLVQLLQLLVDQCRLTHLLQTFHLVLENLHHATSLHLRDMSATVESDQR